MAPYSRGGVLKFATASPTDGTVICCQGRCASNAVAPSEKRSTLIAVFIEQHLGTLISPSVQEYTRQRGFTSESIRRLHFWSDISFCGRRRRIAPRRHIRSAGVDGELERLGRVRVRGVEGLVVFHNVFGKIQPAVLDALDNALGQLVGPVIAVMGSIAAAAERQRRLSRAERFVELDAHGGQVDKRHVLFLGGLAHGLRKVAQRVANL